MKNLEALNNLYEKIERLQKDIKSQEDTLAEWDNNNPFAYDGRKYRNVLINDLKALEMLKKSAKKVLTQMLNEL